MYTDNHIDIIHFDSCNKDKVSDFNSYLFQHQVSMKSLFILVLCTIGSQAKDTFAKDPPRSDRIANDRPSGSPFDKRPSHLSGTPSDYVDYGKYKYPLSRASYPQTKLVGPSKIPSHRPSGSQHGNRPSHSFGTPEYLVIVNFGFILSVFSICRLTMMMSKLEVCSSFDR